MLTLALVDDSGILRSALKNVLEADGYRVAVEAENSQELFERLEKTSVDAVLLEGGDNIKRVWVTARVGEKHQYGVSTSVTCQSVEGRITRLVLLQTDGVFCNVRGWLLLFTAACSR